MARKEKYKVSLISGLLQTQNMVEEPTDRFTRLPPDEIVTRTAQALAVHGMKAIVVDTGEEAKDETLKLIPYGSQVFTVSSRTTAQLGLTEALDESGSYHSVRKDLKRMDHDEQRSEMRKIGSSPDLVVGSVQAITQEGSVLDVSMTGSQLPAYAAGAEKVVWIAGTQKIVKDIDEGMQRVYEYCLPLENQRTIETYGVPSNVNKILVVNREVIPGRITVILVKQNLGF